MGDYGFRDHSHNEQVNFRLHNALGDESDIAARGLPSIGKTVYHREIAAGPVDKRIGYLQVCYDLEPDPTLPGGGLWLGGWRNFTPTFTATGTDPTNFTVIGRWCPNVDGTADIKVYAQWNSSGATQGTGYFEIGFTECDLVDFGMAGVGNYYCSGDPDRTPGCYCLWNDGANTFNMFRQDGGDVGGVGGRLGAGNPGVWGNNSYIIIHARCEMVGG